MPDPPAPAPGAVITHMLKVEVANGWVPVRIKEYPDGRLGLSVADSVEPVLSPAQTERLRDLVAPVPAWRVSKAQEHLRELDAAAEDVDIAPRALRRLGALKRLRIAADDLRNDLLDALRVKP